MSQIKFKLTYFNQRARGEPIRLIFAAAGVPYEDIRLEKSNWPPIKDSYPWGHLPLLEIVDEGQTLAESSAICRFLAKRFKLTGSNEWEEAKCDEYVSAMMDVRGHWLAYFKQPDQQKAAQLKKQFLQIHVPNFFPKFEKLLTESGAEFLLGSKYTWADLHVAHNLAFFVECVDPNVLVGYPGLQKFVKSVFNIPQIKKWVEERPQNLDKAIFNK